MRHLKPFESFIKDGIIKGVSINSERAKSLVSESERKMRSINRQLEKKAKQEGLQKWMSLFWSIFQGKSKNRKVFRNHKFDRMDNET